MTELTSCRVCGGVLTDYYGLCMKHQLDTIRFWERLRSNLAWQKKEQERLNGKASNA